MTGTRATCSSAIRRAARRVNRLHSNLWAFETQFRGNRGRVRGRSLGRLGALQRADGAPFNMSKLYLQQTLTSGLAFMACVAERGFMRVPSESCHSDKDID